MKYIAYHPKDPIVIGAKTKNAMIEILQASNERSYGYDT